MLRLSRAIDRATGYVFVPAAPPPNVSAPPNASTPTSPSAPMSVRPNDYALFSTAVGPLPGHGAQDIQERWVDAKEAYDAFERRAWRQEGESLRERAGDTPSSPSSPG